MGQVPAPVDALAAPVIEPEGASVDALNTRLRGAYVDAQEARYRREVDRVDEITTAFRWNHYESRAIFVVVHALLALACWAAAREFNAALSTRVKVPDLLATEQAKREQAKREQANRNRSVSASTNEPTNSENDEPAAPRDSTPVSTASGPESNEDNATSVVEPAADSAPRPPATNEPAPRDPAMQEFEVGLNKIAIRTSLHGVLLLSIAFAFYIAYLKFVYPVIAVAAD